MLTFFDDFLHNKDTFVFTITLGPLVAMLLWGFWNMRPKSDG